MAKWVRNAQAVLEISCELKTCVRPSAAVANAAATRVTAVASVLCDTFSCGVVGIGVARYSVIDRGTGTLAQGRLRRSRVVRQATTVAAAENHVADGGAGADTSNSTPHREDAERICPPTAENEDCEDGEFTAEDEQLRP